MANILTAEAARHVRSLEAGLARHLSGQSVNGGYQSNKISSEIVEANGGQPEKIKFKFTLTTGVVGTATAKETADLKLFLVKFVNFLKSKGVDGLDGFDIGASSKEGAVANFMSYLSSDEITVTIPSAALDIQQGEQRTLIQQFTSHLQTSQDCQKLRDEGIVVPDLNRVQQTANAALNAEQLTAAIKAALGETGETGTLMAKLQAIFEKSAFQEGELETARTALRAELTTLSTAFTQPNQNLAGVITAFNTQSEALKAAIEGMKSSSNVTLDTAAFEVQVKAQASAIQKLINALGTQPQALPTKAGKPVVNPEQKETDKTKPMRDVLLKQLTVLKKMEGKLNDPKALKAELEKGALEEMLKSMKEPPAPNEHPKPNNKKQLEQLIEKLNEAVQKNGSEKDKKDVAEIQVMLKAMLEINDDQKLAKALNAAYGIKVEETKGPESLNERKGGWAEKFRPSQKVAGNMNINVNSTDSEVGDGSAGNQAKNDAHTSESVVGKKVDHQHDVTNQQIKADQAAIAARVKADAAEKLAAAISRENSAKEGLDKAKKNQVRYQSGVDKGKVGLVGVIAGVVTFMAMVFVNPVAAAALAAVAFVSVVGGAVALHGEARDSANLKFKSAQKELSEATSEKGEAENAAKGSQKDKTITHKFDASR